MGVTTLRWIAVIPGAIVAGLISRAVFVIANSVSLGMMGIDTEWLPTAIAVNVALGVCGVCGAVYAGAWIAPSHKAGAGRIVGALLAAFGILAVVVAIGTDPPSTDMIDIVAGILAGLYFLVRPEVPRLKAR